MFCRLVIAEMLLACLALVSTGCGNNEESLTFVKGHIYYKERLIRQGTIVFTPDSERGGRGDVAIAEIGPDGSYNLKTGNLPGAAPGWHRVTLVAVEEASHNPDPDQFAELRSLLPSSYRDPDLSGLTFEVLPGKVNIKDFHLI